MDDAAGVAHLLDLEMIYCEFLEGLADCAFAAWTPDTLPAADGRPDLAAMPQRVATFLLHVASLQKAAGAPAAQTAPDNNSY